MPTTGKWSIKVEENRSYVFLSQKQLSKKKNELEHIVRADAGEYKTRKCVTLTSRQEFSGKTTELHVNIGKFDWSASDDPFNCIVGMGDEKSWAEECNKCLSDLKRKKDSVQVIAAEQGETVGEPDNTPDTPDDINKDDQEPESEKRKATEQLLDELTLPSKRHCANTKITENDENLQLQVNNCRIDGQFYIPVSNIGLPTSKHRMLREVDELFLSRLQTNMEENCNGAYEPVFLNVNALNTKTDFDHNNASVYQYEVLGGTHNVLATKDLHAKYPENEAYSGRYAWLFVGLTDEQALWVASRHNKTGAFRHEMSFQEEVDLAHQQLEIHGSKASGDTMLPSAAWRDRCALILGKKRKAMTEIYSVAALPENGYQLFKSICSQYEKGRLKDQRALPKDLRGKPTFRPAYVRCLHGLDNVDRIELLNKVAKEDINLDELKVLAKEVKAIRPIQGIISSFLGKPWEIIAKELPECTKAEQLLRFAGKDATHCVFKSYLQELLKKLEGSNDDDTILSPNVFKTKENHQGIIVRCTQDRLNAEQSQFGQRDSAGYAMALYLLEDIYGSDIEKLSNLLQKVVCLVERTNFGIRQTYNLVLIGEVETIVHCKKWFNENRSKNVEMGFLYCDNVKPSGNLAMVQSVRAFMVYHASVGDKLLPEHFNFGDSCPSNLINLGQRSECDWLNDLIRMFSHEGDWVFDINSSQGNAVVAAVGIKRNGLCIVQSDDEEFVTKRNFRKLMDGK